MSVPETEMAWFNIYSQIVFSPNWQLLAVMSEVQFIGLWNTTTGAAILFKTNSYFYRFSLAFTPNSQYLASSSDSKSVEIWNVQTQKHGIVQIEDNVVTIAFSLNGLFIAIGLAAGTIRLLIFSVSSAYEHFDDSITALAFSADGSLLATGWKSRYVGLLSLISGEENHDEYCDEVDVVALSPDRMQIAVASHHSLCLGHINEVEASFIMSCHSSYCDLYDVAFSPTGETIATAHSNNLVKFWAAKTRAEIRTLFGHSEDVHAVTFSSCGDILASGSEDKTVRLWQTYNRAQCGILKGHLDSVWRVSFSPNSELLGSSSHNEVLIWNPRTCEQLYKIHSTICSEWLKFSADSQIITTNNTAYRLPLLLSSAPAGSASTNSSYALAIMDQWITCNMENLLWIPPQYRSEVVATHNLTIALGLLSGEKVIIAFDFSSGRPWEEVMV
jgi:WD40 repeat protein